MINPIGGGWYVTQGGQKVRGKAAAEDLEAQEAAPVPTGAGAGGPGRPTPRQLTEADSQQSIDHPDLAHSLVRGQGPNGPIVCCDRPGCDYERRRW